MVVCVLGRRGDKANPDLDPAGGCLGNVGPTRQTMCVASGEQCVRLSKGPFLCFEDG